MNKALAAGFSLIEIMIVVAVIAIALAIAIPSMMNSRKSGNETSAMGSLKALQSANTQYKTRYNRYARSLSDLQAARCIDQTLGSGTKSGYTFTYAGNANTWSTRANPSQVGRTGDRGFFMDNTGVLRFVATGNATSASAPID